MQTLTDTECKELMNNAVIYKRKLGELSIMHACTKKGFRDSAGCILTHSVNTGSHLKYCDGCPSLSYCPQVHKRFLNVDSKNKNTRGGA